MSITIIGKHVTTVELSDRLVKHSGRILGTAERANTLAGCVVQQANNNFLLISGSVDSTTVQLDVSIGNGISPVLRKINNSMCRVCSAFSDVLVGGLQELIVLTDEKVVIWHRSY